MSRSWSFLGLSEDAENFLRANAHAEEFELRNLSTDEVVNRYSRASGEPSGRITDSWYDEPYKLKRYQLLDGSYCYEYVQAEPWYSGPTTFLALAHDIDGQDPIPETLWDQDLIDQY